MPTLPESILGKTVLLWSLNSVPYLLYLYILWIVCLWLQSQEWIIWQGIRILEQWWQVYVTKVVLKHCDFIHLHRASQLLIKIYLRYFLIMNWNKKMKNYKYIIQNPVKCYEQKQNYVTIDRYTTTWMNALIYLWANARKTNLFHSFLWFLKTLYFPTPTKTSCKGNKDKIVTSFILYLTTSPYLPTKKTDKQHETDFEKEENEVIIHI